jgi:ribosomally synthesized peptide (two-chain TOMM family)
MTAEPKDDRFSHTRPFGHGTGHGYGDKHNIDPAAAENPLVGLEGALAWQYAWTSAIALAWSDKKLTKQLCDDPHKFFKVYTNYILPTGIKLTVKPMETEDGAKEQTGWDPHNKIWYLQKTELTMYIPTPPPLEQQAVALAAYSATARAYPFTGC